MSIYITLYLIALMVTFAILSWVVLPAFYYDMRVASFNYDHKREARIRYERYKMNQASYRKSKTKRK